MRVGRSFTSILSEALLASGLCVTLPVAHAAEKKAAHPGPDAKVVFGIVTAKTDKDTTIRRVLKTRQRRINRLDTGHVRSWLT
jgi:hypothetical protein